MGIEQYKRFLGFRYATLLYSFEEFRKHHGKVVVELGTTRSFVSAGTPGCLVNNPKYWKPEKPEIWDWGAGMFTKMCAIHLQDLNPRIHSVDISGDAIAISQVITSEFSDLIGYHHQSSEAFLETFPDKIDLLYMDAGETGFGTDYLHLCEARIVVERNLMAENGIILIDDVHTGLPDSKGTYSIPFLLEQGYEIKLSGYQVVIQKS